MIGIILKKLLWKFHKDPTSETLSRFHLSSKSLPGVMEDINLEVVSDDRNHPSEASVKVSSKIQHQIPCQVSTCPSSLFLESWRTWRFLTTILMLSDVRQYNKDAFLKISSRSDNRNPIKTQPVLQVSSWSLGGHGGSWRLFWWCQMLDSIVKMLSWKFHQYPSTETSSRLTLSSKFLPGV